MATHPAVPPPEPVEPLSTPPQPGEVFRIGGLVETGSKLNRHRSGLVYWQGMSPTPVPIWRCVSSRMGHAQPKRGWAVTLNQPCATGRLGSEHQSLQLPA